MESIFYLIFALLILGISVVTGANLHYRSIRYRGMPSDHFNGKVFFNVDWEPGETFRFTETEEEFLGKKRRNRVLTFWKWILHQKISLWKDRSNDTVKPETRVYGDTMVITVVGHASVLVQYQGINFLTDPVWKYRASPVEWAGPRRYTKPGIKKEDLPPIDFVLLSHNHYDHMDVPFLRWISDRDHCPIYTGLGNTEYMKRFGILMGKDMDWWDTETRDDTEITFLPSQHFSARALTDRNYTLWGGFAVKINEKLLYFAGDTGYGPFIEKIRERFPGGFHVGMIPIGAYIPRWFMASVHTNPYEGLRMQKDLNIREALGIHFGVFPLAGDLQDEPLQDLASSKQTAEFQNQKFDAGIPGSVWKIHL